MCLGLAGRVAEQQVFNQVSSHGAEDLQKVTKIAKDRVEKYGMNENIGFISFQQDYIERPYSKQLAREMDREMKAEISTCYKRVESIISENRDKLDLVAEELLKKESLTYKDIEQLIGPPKFEKDLPEQTTVFSEKFVKANAA